MHDWLLLSVMVEWETGLVQLTLRSRAGETHIRALDLQDLRIPRTYSWGRSVSINGVSGPTLRNDGFSHLAIEMQSGDVIEIVARSFQMPDSTRQSA